MISFRCVILKLRIYVHVAMLFCVWLQNSTESTTHLLCEKSCVLRSKMTHFPQMDMRSHTLLRLTGGVFVKSKKGKDSESKGTGASEAPIDGVLQVRKVRKESKTRSERAGLQFPVGRIARYCSCHSTLMERMFTVHESQVPKGG